MLGLDQAQLHGVSLEKVRVCQVKSKTKVWSLRQNNKNVRNRIERITQIHNVLVTFLVCLNLCAYTVKSVKIEKIYLVALAHKQHVSAVINS